MNITVNTGDTVPLSLYREAQAACNSARIAAREWELKAGELLVEVAALTAKLRLAESELATLGQEP